jgi:(p)ppGpp synthase/HD superfamily hydrolase
MITLEEKAMLVAEKVHINQSYDIYPYIYHVEQVVDIVKKFGFDREIIIAATLHDVIEDGNLSYNDIKKEFGKEIAEIVYAVTDELGRNRKERKEKTYPKIRANWKATVVKICDRIANMKHSAENKGT